MSQAHVQQYFQPLAKDAAQLEALNAGVKSADEFIARAVAGATQQGLQFSAQEAMDYLDSQSAGKPDGELSDLQLEAVAGGWAHAPSLSDFLKARGYRFRRP